MPWRVRSAIDNGSHITDVCERFSLAGSPMYVCICNAVKCHQVRASVRAGASTPGKVYKSLGVTPNCGLCKTTISEILAEERGCAPASCAVPMMVAAE